MWSLKSLDWGYSDAVSRTTIIVGRSPAYNRGKSPPGYGRTDQGASPGSKSPLSKTDGNSGPAIGGTHAYQPFTEDELTLAMKRSNLQVPAQS